MTSPTDNALQIAKGFVAALTERAADAPALFPVGEHTLVERARQLHPVEDGEFLFGRHV